MYVPVTVRLRRATTEGVCVMSSGNVRVMTWGTILTWAIGPKAAATLIVPIIVALATFVGILFATVGGLSGWLQQGQTAGHCAVASSQAAGPPAAGC